MTGVTPAMVEETPFWELFEAPFPVEAGEEAWEACRDAVSRGAEFVISGVSSRSAPDLGTFCLRFRCARIDTYVGMRLHLLMCKCAFLGRGGPVLWTTYLLVTARLSQSEIRALV